MPRGNLGPVWQHLHRLIDSLPAGEESDGQLLEQFIARREESAFAALVRRHGLLVLRVCRRVLDDPEAAEDAFQATFLILVRKAGSIRRRHSLSSWLYGVAYRVARKARLQGSRRRLGDADLSDLPAGESSGAEESFAELRPILDEELLNLAEKFRAPLVLCYLEGKTYKEAARELGWSEGSMSRRLAQARDRLRRRLLRRGVGVSLAGLTMLLEQSAPAQAGVPPALTDSTVRAALGATARIPASVAGLVTATVPELALPKLPPLAAALCLVGGALSAAGLTAWLAAGPGTAETPAVARMPPAFQVDFRPYLVPEVEFCPEDDLADQNMQELEPEPEPEPAIPEAPVPPMVRFVVQRRHAYSEAELRRQLLQVPEVRLDQDEAQKTSHYLHQVAYQTRHEERIRLVPQAVARRPDLAGLPFRQPPHCELDEAAAGILRNRSRDLRTIMAEALTHEQGWVLAMTLQLNLQKARMFKDDFSNDCAVPTLMQMLQPQEALVRRVLVEQLSRIENRGASKALARLALHDLSPEVRAEAIQALSQRPAHEYRDVLVGGFRYPWPPVADHAAEALVTLQDRSALPLLQEMLAEPDPAAPVYDPARGSHVVRELVRVNHLRNCLLCHAPAPNRSGAVIALVPEAGKPLPPLTPIYYDGPDGIFVRAEVTYLRQDFSVTQPVQDPGPWPAEQRFDYLVRARTVPPPPPAGPAETWPQRAALRYAIEQLQSR